MSIEIKEENGMAIIKLNDDKWNTFIMNFLKQNDIKVSEKDNNITFKTDSIISLHDLLKKEETLDYLSVVNLLNSLAMQLEYLEKKNLYLFTLDPKDITVINNSIFIYTNFDNIYKINDDKQFLLEKQYKCQLFCSPEMVDGEKCINVKSTYYVVASFLIYCLFQIDVSKFEEKQIFETLEPVYYTSLYYFLLRCLNKDPNKRFFIFI
jgi:hypothetical protein